MVYTYIDRDHFEKNSEVAVGNMEKHVPDRLYRSQSYKTMHICLATDVQEAELLKERVSTLP